MRAFIAASLKGNRPLNVFAGAMITRTWQHGTVSSFYPRLADGRYAFCLAQQASAPVPGESGSVYLIWHGQDAFVFGMLYGKRIEPSSRYAILTDLPACLPHLGIEALA